MASLQKVKQLAAELNGCWIQCSGEGGGALTSGGYRSQHPLQENEIARRVAAPLSVGVASVRSGSGKEAMTLDVWGEYDRWNTELASRYFGREWEGTPVYLEPRDDILAEVVEALGVDTDDPLSALVSVVQPTLGVDFVPSAALTVHRSRFATWRHTVKKFASAAHETDSTPPPPVTALLVALVAAATRMGSDKTEAAHAYYPRLNQLFGLHGEAANRLKASFHVTEAFWRGVNEYLEAHEGVLGLPTAYALGHRYVGLPQSQALVRAGDRAKLPDFFQTFGLAAGSEVVPTDLERLLDVWIGSAPSPVSNNLNNLWKRGSARERVCGIAAVELSHWDGTARPGTTASASSRGLDLTLILRKTFAGRKAELSFVTSPRPGDAGRELTVVSAEGRPTVGVIPAPGGRLRPSPGSKLDPASLIGALVEVEDSLDEAILRRRPRRLFVMRHDELVGAWTEVERVQLMEDFCVFVVDDDALLKRALDVIETHGDMAGQFGSPSDSKRDSIPGLPDGWVMLENVRLHSVPQNVKHIEVQPLVPLTSAQLTLAGGLKLPGRIRKWSSLEPPEVRASVPDAQTITIKVWDLHGERALLDEWTEDAQAIVKPLRDQSLEDGDYELELYADDDKTPLSASTLRLRSGDTPDLVSWETCTRLNYELDTSGIGAVSAVAISDESALLVDGANTLGAGIDNVARASLPVSPPWRNRERGGRAPAPAVVLGTADPNSCLVTGKHRIILPTFMGKAEGKTFEGVCEGCGVQKTYPARPRRRRHLPETTAAPIASVVAPSAQPTEVSVDSCLDALVHVGGGPFSALERIATQAEGSSLFVDELVRTLEVLGHIDVRRGPDLQPVEWEGNPSYLAETPTAGYFLAGVWSASARDYLREAVGAEGGTLEASRADSDNLTSWFVQGLDAQQIDAVADSLEDVYAVHDTVDNMMRALPSLSALEEALPLVQIPDYRSAERFDVASASWLPIPGLATSGAYRLSQSFKKVHLWVDHDGATSRQGRLATVHLVKHLAARTAGQPLAAYLPSTQTFIVPLGAELPALYGRALTLCSGRPPIASPRQRVVAYRDVPQAVAEQMQHLLTS